MINHIKHIALALTGLAAVISCERQLPEYSSGEYILFSSPGMTVETRSGELLDAITEDFGVLGYCIPYVQGSHDNWDYNAGTSGWEVKKVNCPPTVFYKQRVSSNGIYDSEGGSANNPKYWYRNGWGLDGPNPNIPADAENYRYTFFAYFPYGDNYWTISPPSESSAGGPILTFTMPQDQGGNVETTRLDATKNIDAMLAMEKDVTRGSGDVTFEFSHILTALGFEINNFSDYSLIVHSLKLLPRLSRIRESMPLSSFTSSSLKPESTVSSTWAQTSSHLRAALLPFSVRQTLFALLQLSSSMRVRKPFCLSISVIREMDAGSV